MSRWTGRRRRFGALFAVVAAVALLTGPAGADPSPSARNVAKGRQQVRERAAQVGRIIAKLAQARGRLDDLNADAESAVERFNGERVKLDQARANYQATQQRIRQAAARLAETRTELAAFAAAAYRTNRTFASAAAVFGGPGGPQGFLERATIMQVMASQRAALLAQERAARTVAAVFEQQARAALAAQQAATAGAAAAWRAATQAVARQRAMAREIEAKKGRLLAALGRAHAHAVDLERRRDAALAAGRTLPRLPKGSGLGTVAAMAALKWLGTPYSWGGGNARGPTLGVEQGAHTVGFDCSGLVTYAWAKAGVHLVHYATSQYYSGPHPSRDRLRVGDLVFFAHRPSDPSTIHHVGIYIGNGRMVEAPETGARVRISYAFRPDYAGATRPVG